MADHNIFVFDNKVYVFGKNSHGQLGLKDNQHRNIPTFLMDGQDVKSICCGINHSMILKNNGDLMVFGDNSCGQLGLENVDKVNKPTLLMNSLEIKSIHCGGFYSMILMKNGELFVFGDNYYGQLGLGNTHNISKPTLPMKDPRIKLICCGRDISMILKNNGELLIFGNNLFGQLGLGLKCDKKYVTTPTVLIIDSEIQSISCGFWYTFILKNNGDLYVFSCNNHNHNGFGHDKNFLEPTLLMNEIKLISCNYFRWMALKNNGDLLVFDTNKNNMAPTVLMNDKNITNILCGVHHSMILKNNGELYVCGDNEYGQLGLGHKENVFKPTLLMTNKTIKFYNSMPTQWTSENHKNCAPSFKQRIIAFVLFLKRNQMKTGLKIPKFVLFEIIKFV